MIKFLLGALVGGLVMTFAMACFYYGRDKKGEVFSQYPCAVFLHNALRFLTEGKVCTAYEEICWALVKAGEELNAEERAVFKELRNKRGDK